MHIARLAAIFLATAIALVSFSAALLVSITGLLTMACSATMKMRNKINCPPGFNYMLTLTFLCAESFLALLALQALY